MTAFTRPRTTRCSRIRPPAQHIYIYIHILLGLSHLHKAIQKRFYYYFLNRLGELEYILSSY